jgi:hypothetical protein
VVKGNVRAEATQMFETSIQLCARMHNARVLMKQRKVDIL